jgi:hypothetical protein
MNVGQMSVGQTIVGQMIVGQMNCRSNECQSYDFRSFKRDPISLLIFSKWKCNPFGTNILLFRYCETQNKIK